ncbi:MAG: PaaI family thioesterase, partial [Desulfobacteraceae bacterium]|nr:PaaI family thioesterase [Desulfobacteraceae bacterium]
YPSHMSMALNKIKLDRAEVVLDLGPYHMQPFGIVHGGVLATLIDTATFWSAFLRLPEDTGLVNVDLKLNYLKPAMEGRLTAFGTCIQAGKSISYSEARVEDKSGKIIAHGTSTLMALPGKGLELPYAKFV